jgi:hypothetical protein
MGYFLGGGEGGIRTHGTVTRTTVFEFYDSHVGMCRPVPKRMIWYAIPKPMILARDAKCHAVSCSWFAIWFANLPPAAKRVMGPAPHLMAPSHS